MIDWSLEKYENPSRHSTLKNLSSHLRRCIQGCRFELGCRNELCLEEGENGPLCTDRNIKIDFYPLLMYSKFFSLFSASLMKMFLLWSRAFWVGKNFEWIDFQKKTAFRYHLQNKAFECHAWIIEWKSYFSHFFTIPMKIAILS